MEKSLNRMKPRLPLNQKINSVTMAMFKKHLSQLLGSSTQGEGQEDLVKSNPLMLYDAEVRPHPLDHTISIVNYISSIFHESVAKTWL